jgi:CelD/BcsL family acetyltransferase involved in cellulose biosynthesis
MQEVALDLAVEAPIAPADAVPQAREVRAATTLQQALALRDGWRQARKGDGMAAPDADPDFFLSVYSALGKDVEPLIALAGPLSQPQGLIVARSASRTIKCGLRSPQLRCLEVVYGGLITDGSPHAIEMIKAFLRALIVDRKVDLLDVHHLDVEHELAAALRDGLGVGARVTCQSVTHWLLELTDPETGLRREHNSGKTRSTFRRKDRKLVESFENDVEVQAFTSAGEVDGFIATAESITTQTYQAALESGVADSARWRAIITALAHGGRLRGYVLRGRGKAIAYVLGGVFERRFTLIATGFLPDHRQLSPGLVLINRVLNALADEKVVIVDFGFGDADYKSLLGNICRQEQTLHIYGRGWRAAATYRMETTATSLTRLAKAAITSLGVFKSIKRAWRRRLERQPSADN